MIVLVYPNGDLGVPEVAEDGPLMGDAYLRIGPDDPSWAAWQHSLGSRWVEQVAAEDDTGTKADWTERLHPRDAHGRFAHKPGVSFELRLDGAVPRPRTPETFVEWVKGARPKRSDSHYKLPDDGKSFEQVAREVHLNMDPPNVEVGPDTTIGQYGRYVEPPPVEARRRERELKDANDLALLRAYTRWTNTNDIQEELRTRLEQRNPDAGTSIYAPNSPLRRITRFVDQYALADRIQQELGEGADQRLEGEYTNPALIRLAAQPDQPGSQARTLARHKEVDPSFDAEAWAREETAHVRKLLDPSTSRIVTRVTSRTLNSILNQGRFKNQIEARHSNGYYDPDMREELERNLFGYPDSADDATRPIYGYVTDDGESNYRAGGFIQQYGDVVVEMKPDVRARTTVTSDDSLDSGGAHEPKIVPMKIDEADWRIGRIGPGFGGGSLDRPTSLVFPPGERLSASRNYLEAHIHGGVTLDDIAVVHFGTDPDPALTRKLDKAGVKWDVRHEETRRATLKWLTAQRYAESNVRQAQRRRAELEAGAELTEYERTTRVSDNPEYQDDWDRRWLAQHPNARAYDERPVSREENIAKQAKVIANNEAKIRANQEKIDEYTALWQAGELMPFRDVRAMSNPKLRDWYIELVLRDAMGQKVEHLLNEADDAAGLRGRHEFEGQGITYPAESRAAKEKWREAVMEVVEGLRASGLTLTQEIVDQTRLLDL